MGRPLEFVSLFSGAGGLDLGFELAGWDCLYASDFDAAAVATLEANRLSKINGKSVLHQAAIKQEDIRFLSGTDILEAIGRKRGQVPLLVGGPPCQSWSSAGHQRGFDDPRGQLFSDFVRIAQELDVSWIVFENVRGLLTARGPDGQPGSALKLIRANLLDAGFLTTVEILNAADFGLPQRRVRLFVIGYRPNVPHPNFPLASHGKNFPSNGALTPWVSLSDCIGELAPVQGDEIILPSPKLRAQLNGLVPGRGVKSPGKKESTRPGGHWGYKQGAFLADPSLPARTVTASAQQDWIEDKKNGIRRLSPRECAALQTFPASWKFVGNRSAQYRLIGNAVPPALGSIIAHELRRHLTEVLNHPKDKDVKLELLPLKPRLNAAIHYTVKEQLRNGQSRSAVPPKRRAKSSVMTG